MHPKLTKLANDLERFTDIIAEIHGKLRSLGITTREQDSDNRFKLTLEFDTGSAETVLVDCYESQLDELNRSKLVVADAMNVFSLLERKGIVFDEDFTIDDGNLSLTAKRSWLILDIDIRLLEFNCVFVGIEDTRHTPGSEFAGQHLVSISIDAQDCDIDGSWEPGSAMENLFKRLESSLTAEELQKDCEHIPKQKLPDLLDILVEPFLQASADNNP